jgi:hypothetical protein
MGVNQNRRPRPSVPIHTKRRRQTKKLTRPYTITQQPVVASPLAGMATWVRLACKHSDGCLWNNGVWVVRDQRSRPGTVSNHARGLACDLSYRWQAQKNRGVKDGRKQSLAYIVKLLQNADTLGIQLVIDYQLQRSWKCDRGTWQPLPSVDQGDWYHLEVAPKFAHDPEATKQAFQAVFGVSPKAAPKPV